MTSEEHRIIQEMIRAAIIVERARISEAVSNVSMNYTGGYYGDSSPDFGRFVDDIARAIAGD